jgi:hypothetical protein
MVFGSTLEINSTRTIKKRNSPLRTITIKQDIVDSLDSDQQKIEFANSVIGLLSDSIRTTDRQHDEVLINGLNQDIPEPMDGAPEFDSANMSAPEYKRYSLLRAGYVPAGGNGLFGSLDCPYSDYIYKHLSTLSKSKFDYLRQSVESKIKQSKGKRDYLKFLKYLGEIYSWYFRKFIFPSLIREDIDT